MSKRKDSWADFVDSLQRHGRYTFTRREAKKATGATDTALTFALHRLGKRGRLVAVRKGFYVIVPVEFQSSGILPPDWFIADLMKFLNQPYYVALLSAAAYHGAGHQQPQWYHVVTTKSQRPIVTKGLGIRFFRKATAERTPVQQIKTRTGYIAVSTPGATAIDLVGYRTRVGRWPRVATVLQELVEVMDETDLLTAAQAEPEMQPVQRLGWALGNLGHPELTGKLAEWLHQRRLAWTPLDPSRPHQGCPRDPHWRVVVNTKVEGEL